MEPNRNNFYPYKKARLVHYDYSPTQKWYIIFYAWDVDNGKLKRRRIFDINDIADLDQRKVASRRKIDLINSLLAKGYHFDKMKQVEQERQKILSESPGFLTVDMALNKILDIKSFSNATLNSYRSNVNLFLEFLGKHNQRHINVKDLNKNMVLNYVDYLNGKGYAGKTINNKISFLKAIFNEIMERDLADVNPFIGVKKQKEIITEQNIAYNDTQINLLKTHLLEHDLQLWHFIQFIFYGFLRPNEIRQLKVAHVKLKTNKIFIPAQISKTKRDRFIEVTKTFKQTLLDMGVDKHGGDEYLFSQDLKPGPVPFSKNAMAVRYKTIREELGMSNEYTMYSWKHTGVVKAYEAGVGLEGIRLQCGHTEIQTTITYLKSLGLLGNVEFREKFGKVSL